MPSKKKKYNARFPAGRIKKIMQSDEEIGKVAQAVPVIISRTLELFVESLINKTLKITNSRNAKTLSTSHMKQCIMAEQRFDFLRELVKNIPDISIAEEAANYQEDDAQSSPEQQIYPDSDTPYDLSMQSTSTRAPRNRNNSGELKQQHVKNRHSENGNTTMAPYVMPSHEEHMRPFVEGRGNLKRQAAMTSHSFSEDVGVSSQRNSSKANLYENETHGIVDGEKLTTHEDEKLAHLDREASIRKHINQRQKVDYPSIATPNSSVIRHTISFSTTDTLKPDLPPKLYRTDSAPATAAGDWQSQSHDTMFSYKKSVSAQHQKRLKHQPQSEPLSTTIFNPLATANISETALNTNVQVNPLEIPAPVVNIDFSNKPVVKIEYKNLGNPAQTSILPIAPVSAPATVTNKNMSGFNFDSAPVINIDLSNIVADSSNPRSDSAVATISIGNIAPIPSFIKPLVAAPTNLEKNSKSMTSSTGRTVLSTIETKNDATPSSSTTSVPVPKNINSFFELDEDYDNI